VSFLSYTFRQFKIKTYRATCLLKKLTCITVECVKEKFTHSDVGYSNFNEIMFMYDTSHNGLSHRG
jgi:hypothetical protein